MGVWTLNSEGFSERVLLTKGFMNSDRGGRGSGLAVSDHSAVVGERDDPSL